MTNLKDLELWAVANGMPKDQHKETAANIFDVPYGSVTPEQRRYAKGVNYANWYGWVSPLKVQVVA